MAIRPIKKEYLRMGRVMVHSLLNFIKILVSDKHNGSIENTSCLNSHNITVKLHTYPDRNNSFHTKHTLFYQLFQKEVGLPLLWNILERCITPYVMDNMGYLKTVVDLPKCGFKLRICKIKRIHVGWNSNFESNGRTIMHCQSITQ
jgi:hypothetical protein